VWVFVVARFWRHEPAAELQPGISANKIVPLRLSVSASLRGVGRLQLGVSGRLPWRKLKENTMDTGSSNKLCYPHLSNFRFLFLSWLASVARES
jgi:hypothetical protein